MTEFERGSLSAFQLQAYTGLGVVLVGVISVIIVYWQLNKMGEANRLSNFVAILGLEEQVRSALAKWVHSEEELANVRAAGKPEESHDVKTAVHRQRIATETYLTVLDRFCASIRREYIPEREYKPDYEQPIRDAVSRFEKDLGLASRYQNIRTVQTRWNEQKSAADRLN